MARIELKKCPFCGAEVDTVSVKEKDGNLNIEVKRKDRWIPCIARLPEQLQTVIICTDINTVTVAWLNGDHWTFADTGNGHTEDWSFEAVKYWMNLPEPPESEVQE